MEILADCGPLRFLAVLADGHSTVRLSPRLGALLDDLQLLDVRRAANAHNHVSRVHTTGIYTQGTVLQYVCKPEYKQSYLRVTCDFGYGNPFRKAFVRVIVFPSASRIVPW